MIMAWPNPVNFSPKLLHLWLKEHSRRGSRKIVRTRGICEIMFHRECVNKASSSMIPQEYDCLNKISTKTTSLEMLLWKREISQGPTPRQRTRDN